MPRREEDEIALVFHFAALGDVFDYAERIIPAHDWERGTIHRLSQILTALHRAAPLSADRIDPDPAG